MISRLVVLLGLCFSGIGWAADQPIEAFFGEYIGTISNGGERDRDLNVTIRSALDGEGFEVKWTTVTHKSDGRTKRKTYRIPFTTTERRNIFESAMRTNVFGGKTSLDPMRGDPLFWARINGDTLTVNAFRIEDDGGYSMQVYKRTLTAKGLHLEFIRKKSEQPLVRIEAELIRVAD